MEVLAIRVDQQRVLPAEDMAIVEGRAIAFDAQRHRLAVIAGSGADGQILRGEVIAEHDDAVAVVARRNVGGDQGRRRSAHR